MINNFKKFFWIIFVLMPTLCFGYDYQYEEDPVDDGIISELNSFKAVIALVKKHQKPLLLEFSTAWCEYCAALEDQVLKPMIQYGEYEKKIIIRKFEVDDNVVINLHGKKITGSDFAMQQNVNVYPTLVFYNGEGKEISQRIVGITTLDYIGEHIDKAIIKAKQEMSLSF